ARRLERADPEQVFEGSLVAPVLVEAAQPVEVGLAHEAAEPEPPTLGIISDSPDQFGRECQAVREPLQLDVMVHRIPPILMIDLILDVTIAASGGTNTTCIPRGWAVGKEPESHRSICNGAETHRLSEWA